MKLTCPKCSGALRVADAARGALLECDGCEGSWVDLSGRLPLGLAEFVEADLRRLVQSLATRAVETGYTCPQCRSAPLDAQVIGHVEVDWCPHCPGLFLDRSELASLAPPMAAPPVVADGTAPGPLPAPGALAPPPAAWTLADVLGTATPRLVASLDDGLAE